MVFDKAFRARIKRAQCGRDSLTVSLDLHSTGQRLRAQTKVEASDTIYEIQRRVARVVRPQSLPSRNYCVAVFRAYNSSSQSGG